MLIRPFAEHDGLADAEAWVAHQIAAFTAKTAFDFVLTDDTDTIVGGCGLNQFDLANRRANIGYWVRTSSVGRGHATAPVKLLVRWAMENTDFQRGSRGGGREPGQLARGREGRRNPGGVLKSRLLLYGAFHDAVMHAFVCTDELNVGKTL